MRTGGKATATPVGPRFGSRERTNWHALAEPMTPERNAGQHGIQKSGLYFVLRFSSERLYHGLEAFRRLHPLSPEPVRDAAVVACRKNVRPSAPVESVDNNGAQVTPLQAPQVLEGFVASGLDARPMLQAGNHGSRHTSPNYHLTGVGAGRRAVAVVNVEARTYYPRVADAPWILVGPT